MEGASAVRRDPARFARTTRCPRDYGRLFVFRGRVRLRVGFVCWRGGDDVDLSFSWEAVLLADCSVEVDLLSVLFNSSRS